MANATFEELFNASILDVVVPVTSIGLPNCSPDEPHIDDEWVQKLAQEDVDRNMAFFDENLDFVLALRIEDSSFAFPSDSSEPASAPNPKHPPANILAFLAHLQITYEASYIVSLPTPQQRQPLVDPSDPRPVPVRTISINRSQAQPSRPSSSNQLKPSPQKPQTRGASLAAPTNVSSSSPSSLSLPHHHPSIFPPATPNPVPSTTDSDRQYVQAQGTLLRTGMWGEAGEVKLDKGEGFALIWAREEACWIAVFRLSIQVSFMPTKVPDPLLCLTVSTTLREKPLAVSPVRKALQALIDSVGGLPNLALGGISPARTPRPEGDDDADEIKDDFTGLEEVNLLAGLTLEPTFSKTRGSTMYLPSTRLGDTVRKEAFSLPPATPEPPSPQTSQSTATLAGRSALGPHATLRKSFRKTLPVVSGFRVRMRTVFVPYFMMPQDKEGRKGSKTEKRKSSLDVNSRSESGGGGEDTDEENDEESDEEDELLVHERELREAGNEEHTVILCIEVENAQSSRMSSSQYPPSSTSTPPFGFSVESVDVTVSGEGAQTRLIAWGEAGLTDPEIVFPLYLGPNEQYNLLYAVSFLRGPESDDQFSLARGKGLSGNGPGPAMTQELQRAVAITINGRPYEFSSLASAMKDPPLSLVYGTGKKSPSPSPELLNSALFPTPVFPSRWNCVLDLSSNMVSPSLGGVVPSISNPQGSSNPGEPTPKKEVLPTPASPFPTSGRPRSFAGIPNSFGKSPTGSTQKTPTQTMLVAGSKRYTLSAMDAAAEFSGNALGMTGTMATKMRPPLSPVNYQFGAAMLNPANQYDPSAQSGTLSVGPNGTTGGGGGGGGVVGGGVGLAGTTVVGSTPINPMLGPTSASTRSSYIPPSMTVHTYAKSPTTYGPISPPLPPIPPAAGMSFGGAMAHLQGGSSSYPYQHRPGEDSVSSTMSSDLGSIPSTPAYPAYPASPSPPMSPPPGFAGEKRQSRWQGPIISNLQGATGPTVEIRRERMMSGPGIPQTPGPRVGPGIPGGQGGMGGGGGGAFAQMQNEMLNGTSAEGEPIVVSVGLSDPLKSSVAASSSTSRGRKISPEAEAEASSSSSSLHLNGNAISLAKTSTTPPTRTEAGKIYPMDTFTLDIFVYNQSSWTRRFEVSYPDRRKRRKELATMNANATGTTPSNARKKGFGSREVDGEVVGVLPLENRVRVGPLHPSTCQSVRMDFLALTPGVHSIDTLTLTDVQTGYSMDLRNVIDVVVHEHPLP